MQEEGIKPGKLELAFYRVLRIAFWKDDLLSTGRFYKEAAELFNSMKRNGFSPDSYTYLALVRAYASSQKLMEAEEVISLMQNEEVGISPYCESVRSDRFIMSAAVHLYRLAGFAHKAEDIFGSSRSVDEETYLHKCLLDHALDEPLATSWSLLAVFDLQNGEQD
ncbi:pentatricopeptide repeat-containing protein [Tanacetum coccineum]